MSNNQAGARVFKSRPCGRRLPAETRAMAYAHHPQRARPRPDRAPATGQKLALGTGDAATKLHRAPCDAAWRLSAGHAGYSPSPKPVPHAHTAFPAAAVPTPSKHPRARLCPATSKLGPTVGLHTQPTFSAMRSAQRSKQARHHRRHQMSPPPRQALGRGDAGAYSVPASPPPRAASPVCFTSAWVPVGRRGEMGGWREVK
jgi:hypothetical protein